MSVTESRPSAAVLTQGCKVNQYESEAIAEALAARGFTIRPPQEVCDLYVVNTCTVTAESDRKARQAIRRLLSENPEAFLIVTGCSAQKAADAIAAIPGVDCIVGNRNKLAVADAAVSLWRAGVKPARPLLEVGTLEGSAFEAMTITHFERTRAYVKIEDGCECRCTYCAIPDARGPVRSKPAEAVLDEVRGLVAGGCREVVLTGIETGSWGRDLPDSPRLCDLLRAVDALPGIGRVRLGSLDPSVMTPRFVEIVSALPSLAPHFHLSVQSGCSATLARMHRRYNADQAEAAIARLRAAIPHVQLTTDMIVGFPGETEEEFAASLAFARRVGFLHIHVFPYSRRAGTPAATMPEQVPEPIRRRRAAELSAVSEQSRDAILDAALRAGRPLSVLFESCEGGMCFGHTPEFLEVRVAAGADLRGSEATVLPRSRDGGVLTAELI